MPECFETIFSPQSDNVIEFIGPLSGGVVPQ